MKPIESITKEITVSSVSETSTTVLVTGEQFERDELSHGNTRFKFSFKNKESGALIGLFYLPETEHSLESQVDFYVDNIDKTLKCL